MKRHLIAISVLTIIFLSAVIAEEPQTNDYQIDINPDSVTIVRDEWGVPHIYGETDEEAAYGLAWANAEDDFKTMQEPLLAVNGMLGKVQGKEGAIKDYLMEAIRADEIVDKRMEEDLSPDFRRYLTAYAQGVNDYAEAHPEEQEVKKIFPIAPSDIIKGFMFHLSLMSGVHEDVKKIVQGKLDVKDVQFGSNSYAMNPTKTADSSTMLCINSHQPVRGPFSWYEAHINSEEGLNMLGGTFDGGPAIFLGTNDKLGWAHTFNDPDVVDVYKLNMHPGKNLQYKFDGEWRKLERETIWLKVQIIGFLPIPVPRKAFYSVYGPTFKSSNGSFYAVRYPQLFDIRAAEQWFRMNKAQSFSEFHNVLQMQALPKLNIMYADVRDTIYYTSQGIVPKRNDHYDYSGVIPGDTSANLWTDYHPLSDFPQKLNPSCGYLFNMNNTPFNATCDDEDLDPSQFEDDMGFREHDNNRSIRFERLISKFDKVDFSVFQNMKYDMKLADSSNFVKSVKNMIDVPATEYPQVADLIEEVKSWDFKIEKDDEKASVFLLAFRHVFEKLGVTERPFYKGLNADEEDYVEGLLAAKDHLNKHFGTTDVPLGQLQRHVRGNKDLPLLGFPDVLAANYNKPYEDGHLKQHVGDSYIQFVKYDDGGVAKIESIHPFGASNDPESPHYDDQMKLYVNQKTKEMTLNKDTIFSNAKRIYHPQAEE